MTKISMADFHRHFSDDIKALNPDLFGETQITSHRQLDAELKADKLPRANKFGARKTIIGDLTFDSKAEANRYLELKALEERGEIKNLILQCQIILLEGFTYQGEKVRPITYKADFVYVEGSKTVVEDFKSSATAKTEAFRLRWRLLQWYYRNHPDVICRVTGA